MGDQALFTKFWIKESKTTRNVFARVPEGSDYRPDPKSRTAREIAWQIVYEERMLVETLERGQTDWAPPPVPETMKDVLAVHAAQSDEHARRLTALPPSRWDATVDFFGRPVPAADVAWGFLLDIVHHRGQISTYLRPMGSTVPQIYGPSADEP